GHDADEEVRREERPEDHDLGDDEQQHPEQLRLDARGAVGRRWTVVVVLGVGDRGGFHDVPYATASAVSADSTCSTGLLDARRTRSMRSARIHPERVAGRVEMTMSSTRKNCSAFMTAL